MTRARRETSAVNLTNDLPKLLLASCVLLCCMRYSLAYRILLTPVQGYSLIMMHVSIGEELIRRGHDVHIAVASRYSNIEPIRRKGIHVLNYHIPHDVVYTASAALQQLVTEYAFNPPEDILKLIAEKWSPLYDANCEFMMKDQMFMDEVKSLHFDLVLTNTVGPSACTLILPHYLELPFVTIPSGSFPSPWHFGLPALPSFCAGGILKSGRIVLAELSTLYGRLLSTIGYLALHLKTVPVVWGNKSLLEQFARPSVTSWVDLLHQSQLFLYESDYHLNTGIPLLPNVVTIAGVTVRPAKPLPDSLQKLFDESGDNGVIVVSFGATSYNIPPDIIQKFFDGLTHVKQTVIARLPAPDGTVVPENVKLMQWIPQNDILGHNNTKLFITHCGHNGLYEALYHGVPMIGFPLFAEQTFNCERMVRKSFGLQVDVKNFTASELSRNIRELLDNNTYTKTIGKASASFRNQPMTGVEKAAFWIEYVAKHGGGHLRSPILDRPLYQILMLDIVAALAILVLICLFLAACTVRLMFKNGLKLVASSKLKSD